MRIVEVYDAETVDSRSKMHSLNSPAPMVSESSLEPDDHSKHHVVAFENAFGETIRTSVSQHFWDNQANAVNPPRKRGRPKGTPNKPKKMVVVFNLGDKLSLQLIAKCNVPLNKAFNTFKQLKVCSRLNFSVI